VRCYCAKAATNREQVDNGRDDVASNDCSDLSRSAGGDVGQGPARLLAQGFLVMEQHLAQKRKRSSSNDTVCLLVVACDDVANGTQGGSLDEVFTRRNELNEVLNGHVAEESVDALLVAVADVGHCPANVGKNFTVLAEHKAGHGGKRWGDEIKTRCWLATAEVGERPGCIAEEGLLVSAGGFQDREEGSHGVGSKHLRKKDV
jgi:hypothetical protein